MWISGSACLVVTSSFLSPSFRDLCAGVGAGVGAGADGPNQTEFEVVHVVLREGVTMLRCDVGSEQVREEGGR
jgi:hypothetical protein